jgi:hypothetical protein
MISIVTVLAGLIARQAADNSGPRTRGVISARGRKLILLCIGGFAAFASKMG